MPQTIDAGAFNAQDRMSVADFLAFIEERPDDERWELIDGEPILNSGPSLLHQIVVGNLIVALSRQRPDRNWMAIPGVGTVVSPFSLPLPDVLVRPNGLGPRLTIDDAIVIVEVLSPSTRRRDLHWKRRAYAELPSLAHYVVISKDEPFVRVFDREAGFVERVAAGAKAEFALPAIGATLTLADIYADTGLIGDDPEGEASAR